MAVTGDLLLREQGDFDDVMGTSHWVYALGVVLRDAVYISAADTVGRAGSAISPETPCIGIVARIDYPSVGRCLVRHLGDVSGFTGLTVGARYILSSTPGGLVLSSGGVGYPGSGEAKQIIGVARTTTILHVNPSPFSTVVA